MALTITPAVSGAGRRRGIVHLLIHFAGLLTGALLTIATLRVLLHVALAHVAGTVVFACIVAVAAFGILRDAGARVPTPYLERQVPEWLRSVVPMGVTSYAYGTMLGLGFATRYTYAAHSVMALGVALLPPGQLIPACVLFAAFKSLGLVATPWKVSRADVADAFDRRFYWRRYGTYTLRFANIVAAVAGLAAVAQLIT